MGGGKTIPAAALLHCMDQLAYKWIVAGAWPLEKGFHKTGGELVGKRHHQGNSHQYIHSVPAILADDQVDQKKVKGEPEEFVANPKHSFIKERIIVAVELQQQLSIQLND